MSLQCPSSPAAHPGAHDWRLSRSWIEPRPVLVSGEAEVEEVVMDEWYCTRCRVFETRERVTMDPLT